VRSSSGYLVQVDDDMMTVTMMGGWRGAVRAFVIVYCYCMRAGGPVGTHQTANGRASGQAAS
jgi:hypothetical protein